MFCKSTEISALFEDYPGRFLEEGILAKTFVMFQLELYNVDAYLVITNLDERTRSFFRVRQRKAKPRHLYILLKG